MCVLYRDTRVYRVEKGNGLSQAINSFSDLQEGYNESHCRLMAHTNMDY